MRKINLALLGMGTVGRGVAETLRMNRSLIEQQLGCSLQLKWILVRDMKKYEGAPVPEGARLTDRYEDIASDCDVDIIIEVMGGIHPAKEYICSALQRHVSVVSANKDLIALFGPEIIQLAVLNGVNFSCEASVGGGIPILQPMHQSLSANRIDKIIGIVNGTTNYILSRMTAAGLSYEAALSEAGDKGYAEADPTNDVCGFDAARKLAIMASIGFRANVTFDDVIMEGIQKITDNDIRYARDMGYIIKLLAVGLRQDQGISLNVYPAFVPEDHPLASVQGSYNAIYVTGNAVGEVMFYGRGAGSLPTASAVMGDVIDTAEKILNRSTGTGMIMTDISRIPFYSSQKLRSPYYFRLIVDDATGVLADISHIFAEHDISIKTVTQKSQHDDVAELVLVVESSPRENIMKVEKALAGLSCVRKTANIIRVLEEN